MSCLKYIIALFMVLGNGYFGVESNVGDGGKRLIVTTIDDGQLHDINNVFLKGVKDILNESEKIGTDKKCDCDKRIKVYYDKIDGSNSKSNSEYFAAVLKFIVTLKSSVKERVAAEKEFGRLLARGNNNECLRCYNELLKVYAEASKVNLHDKQKMLMSSIYDSDQKVILRTIDHLDFKSDCYKSCRSQIDSWRNRLLGMEHERYLMFCKKIDCVRVDDDSKFKYIRRSEQLVCAFLSSFFISVGEKLDRLVCDVVSEFSLSVEEEYKGIVAESYNKCAKMLTEESDDSVILFSSSFKSAMAWPQRLFFKSFDGYYNGKDIEARLSADIKSFTLCMDEKIGGLSKIKDIIVALGRKLGASFFFVSKCDKSVLRSCKLPTGPFLCSDYMASGLFLCYFHCATGGSLADNDFFRTDIHNPSFDIKNFLRHSIISGLQEKWDQLLCEV